MIEKIKGCIFGLAIGDALGAPIEFMQKPLIIKRYGKEGIKTLCSTGYFPAGTYTDDTQMSLATAKGCINYFNGEKDIIRSIHKEYMEWYQTQTKDWERRAPGLTCMEALSQSQSLNLEKDGSQKRR